VYVTLKRLEAKELVSSEARAGEGEGTRKRKYFTLLPAGMAELAKAKEMLDSLWARAGQQRLGGRA
jgi:DNA-binding PadR family transcriptional regulator